MGIKRALACPMVVMALYDSSDNWWACYGSWHDFKPPLLMHVVEMSPDRVYIQYNQPVHLCRADAVPVYLSVTLCAIPAKELSCFWFLFYVS